MFSKINQEKKVYKHYPSRQMINILIIVLLNILILVGIPLLELELKKKIIPDNYRNQESINNIATFITLASFVLLNKYNPAYVEVECKKID